MAEARAEQDAGRGKAVQPFLLPGGVCAGPPGLAAGAIPRLEAEIRILAAVAPQGDDSVTITGRVLHAGRGFRGATVVAVANTRLGNEYSAEGKTQGGPQATAASDPGSFELVLSRKVAPGPGPRPSLVRTITSVTIRASNDDNTLDGTELLTVSRADQLHQDSNFRWPRSHRSPGYSFLESSGVSPPGRFHAASFPVLHLCIQRGGPDDGDDRPHRHQPQEHQHARWRAGRRAPQRGPVHGLCARLQGNLRARRRSRVAFFVHDLPGEAPEARR